MIDKNNYNPIVTKNELIDIIYDSFKYSITKNILEYMIDNKMNDENNITEIYCITKEDIFLQSITNEKFNYNKKELDNVIISSEYKEINYFRIEDDKFIYFYSKPNIIKDFDYLEQIKYILTNNLNKNVNNDKLKYLQANYIKHLNNIQKEESLDIRFKEFDYIKIVCENNHYNDIGIKNIKECIDYLNYNNSNIFLTIEEQIILRLIVLLGIKNIYLNNTEYYKDKCRERIIDINQVIELISENIKFIKENMHKITEEIIYSLNYQYALNLKDYCSRIFVYLENDYSVWNRNTSLYEKVDNEFISFLRYICFDYYVSNKRFEDAKIVFKKDLPLFKYLKSSSYSSEHMILELIDLVLEKTYKYGEKEEHRQYENLNNILSGKDKTLLYNYFYKLSINQSIKTNIKVLLKFYIDCYYYFKHFNDDENTNKIFELLLYFKDGYGIEDFIFKCKYMRMVEVLNGKKIENIGNIEEVDNAINELESLIDDMKLINQFDIDDVENNYNNINFNNFKKENREYVKKCIATGDKIMNTFNTIDIDFSNVVVEWSKAVETEIDEKLFSDEIIKYSEKCIIEKNFRKVDFKGNEISFRLKRSNDITVGIFNDMENYTNGNDNLSDYLYNKYFSQYYILNEETYKNLCKYLKTISKPRNESAHKGKTIDKNIAMDCKEKILASEKILEILSKLEKK